MNILLRRIIHIGMVAFALAIGRWDPAWIALAAVIALLVNVILLPALSRGRIERGTASRFYRDPGLISYPLSILLLSLLFWDQQIYVVVGWGAMAFGDSAAQWLGQTWKSSLLSWNREKSWAGLAGFWLSGTLFTWLLLALIPSTTYPAGITWADWLPILAVVMGVSAWAESLRGSIDDNLWVPMVAAFVGWVTIEGLPFAMLQLPDDGILGASAIALFMLLSWLSGKIDLSGTLVGGILAGLIFAGSGWAGLGCLLLLFVIGSVASSFGKKKKQEWGLAQEQGGKRSARHAFCNAGVAGILGWIAFTQPELRFGLSIVMAASLASATSDTLSSELGTLIGRRYWSVLTLRKGTRGQDGMISLEGTLAGILGAGIVAGGYVLASGISAIWILPIVVAATLANIVDSLLGATFQTWDLMTNDSVNFASTLAGAGFAHLIIGQM